jgi:hypothetical protein
MGKPGPVVQWSPPQTEPRGVSKASASCGHFPGVVLHCIRDGLVEASRPIPEVVCQSGLRMFKGRFAGTVWNRYITVK